MALFDDAAVEPRRPRRLSGSARAGLWALVVALIALLVLTFLPTSYVIQLPGPVYNTLGTAEASDGTDVPLISIQGADTYPTAGSLDLLTVQVRGTRERTPSWVELAQAWFDPTRAVVPIDSVFPAGQTTEERNEQSAALMTDSQQEATAAALFELGYDVPHVISVYEVTEGSAAEGILKKDDVLLSVDGEEVTDAEAVRELVNAGDGAPVELTIERDGAPQTVEVTPTQSGTGDETVWLLGIRLLTEYDFPIDVTIQLNNVGGPSAGMMFALGIIDMLTPGELNGGENVAGTGTITADGTVGPIGGIRQKMWGALDAGAEWFLAPASNCGEVVGYVPDGLRVFAVATLGDSLEVLEAISEGGDLDALPACTLN